MLTAKQRERRIDLARQHKEMTSTRKAIPTKAENKARLAWLDLASYHFSQLRRDLMHIICVKTNDEIERDIYIENRRTPLFLSDYLKHYRDRDLTCIENCIDETKEALQYLERAIDKEKARRKGGIQ